MLGLKILKKDYLLEVPKVPFKTLINKKNKYKQLRINLIHLQSYKAPYIRGSH